MIYFLQLAADLSKGSLRDPRTLHFDSLARELSSSTTFLVISYEWKGKNNINKLLVPPERRRDAT